MGQGLYTMLAYGVLAPPWLADDDDGNDALVSACIDLKMQHNYECEPGYLVIPLAVDDEWLQEHWKLKPLPDMLPHPTPRTARALLWNAELLNMLAPHYGHRKVILWVAELALLWQQAQQLYAKAGLALGLPGLIVLNDWV